MNDLEAVAVAVEVRGGIVLDAVSLGDGYGVVRWWRTLPSTGPFPSAEYVVQRWFRISAGVVLEDVGRFGVGEFGDVGAEERSLGALKVLVP